MHKHKAFNKNSSNLINAMVGSVINTHNITRVVTNMLDAATTNDSSGRREGGVCARYVGGGVTPCVLTVSYKE